MRPVLSKEADALVCVLYKTYLLRRKDGVSKAAAKLFGSSEDIQAELLPKWIPEDVDETCRELDNNNLLDCCYADDIAYETVLTDQAIVYMEQRFKNGLKDVLGHIKMFKDILPLP